MNATNYKEAEAAKREGDKVYAFCPVCGVEQVCFVDLPEETHSSPCEVACCECMTVIFVRETCAE